MSEQAGYGTQQASAALDELRRKIGAAYILYAATLLVGVTAIVGVIIAYLCRRDVAGTWLESHVRWLIRTFWISLGLWVVAYIVMAVKMLSIFGDMAIAEQTGQAEPGLILEFFGLFGVLALAILAVTVWFIYRIVKGGLRFMDGKPIGAA